MAREDIRWLLALTAPRVHAANRFMYRKTGLDEATLARTLELLATALAGGEPRTRAELGAELRAAGVESEGLRLGYILMHAELEALVCSGPRRGRQHTYARLDDRAPGRDGRSREEALAELARRYFTSRGPATVRDFAAPGRRARPPALGAHLIPMYDETVMGYKELRVVFAQPPPRPGLLERPVLLFTSLDPAGAAALEPAAARWEAFLGLPVTLGVTSCGG